MKITEIRIDRTKSLGNYENIKLGFTAVVEEDENTVDAIERVKTLLDWEINREDRDRSLAGYRKRLAEIAELDTPEAITERTKIEKWIATYLDRKAQIETYRS